MQELLSDTDLRFMAISLLTADTARDMQAKIGASNLSNGCDFCLASNLTGDMRETQQAHRAWGGRVLGTALHAVLEGRINDALTFDGLDEVGRRRMSQQLAAFAQQYPDALAEVRMILGSLGSYGEVGSTSDLVIPSRHQAIDWKGTTDAKLAVMCDYLALSRGEEAPYGRTHKVHKKKTLSEKVYQDEIVKTEYKITGYYGQLQMYGLGLHRLGYDIRQLSNIFISRDSTMWFDNPAADRYDDPKAMHGVYVLSFPYDGSYAEAMWSRGLQIWEALENGATPSDFPRHECCFPCSLDGRDTTAAVAA